MGTVPLSPLTMNQPALIVLERSGDWAVALRRHLDPDVRVVETRSLRECTERLREHPAAIAALELTPTNPPAIVQFLARAGNEFPAVRAVVVASRQMAEYENLIREAGAIHFVVSTRSLGEVAEIIRRRQIQLEAISADIPDDAQDPRPAILANLPWSKAT